MKVYGWTAMGFGGKQVRVICAAKSLAAASRASEAAGLGRIHRDFCSTTGNDIELEVALAQPGIVFMKGLDDHHGRFEAQGI